jgi:hypothetical protein
VEEQFLKVRKLNNDIFYIKKYAPRIINGPGGGGVGGTR